MKNQFNEQEILNNLLDFTKEIKDLLSSGKTLKEICQWSYQQRESGRNIPYLAVGQSGADGYLLHNLSTNKKNLKPFLI